MNPATPYCIVQTITGSEAQDKTLYLIADNYGHAQASALQHALHADLGIMAEQG